jgi:methylated-DNA-[protein]-cysteine S-methyltransferase
MLYYYVYQTPIGEITLQSIDETIVGCYFGKRDDGQCLETKIMKKAYQQLDEYFQGQRQQFDISIKYIKGTDFQQKVWDALQSIPYGETVSYQDIAVKVGSKKAYRAVGNANHHNPIVIFIPCHRVITSQGQLGGYGGGLDKKRYLLELEKKWKRR